MYDYVLQTLLKRIETVSQSAVRHTVASSRFSQKLEELQGKDSVSGSITIMSKPNETLVAGHGPIYERFLKTREITGYTGEGSPFSYFFDEEYEDSPLKVVRFDQSFKHLPYDARHRKYKTFDNEQYISIDFFNVLFFKLVHLSTDAMYDPKVDVILKRKRSKRGKY